MALGSPVDLIKSKLDLMQVVSGYVSGLKKSGRNWWACCPFHSEKTPSFCLWPEEDRWKCFGCGAGGDVFAFIMRIENLDFPGALKLLAEKAGVAIEERPRQQEGSGQKKRLLELNAAASLWFHNMLLTHPSAAHARAFAERRHLTHQTLLDFQLGYAPDSWDMLRNALLERGYTPDEQLAAGVLHESEKGRPYDRFRNRLIYPIRDSGGHVIAFGGRELGEEKKGAKFINSPQTELFDKSATLYALDLARNAIRSLDRAIVVEGYMDAIMAHQHGYANVVCSMGTSLTEQQVQQIKRLTTNLVLALDPDVAGDIATGRGVEVGELVFDRELIPVAGVNGLVHLESRLKADIRIMTLPRGKDPDEVIHENPGEWPRLVEGAVPLLEYKFQQIIARHDLHQPKQKMAAVEELGIELQLVPDPIERAHYVQKMATALRMPEWELNLAMSRKTAEARPKRARAEADGSSSSRTSETPQATGTERASLVGLDVEDYLVMRALRYLDSGVEWSHNLRTEEIAKSANREVLQLLLASLQRGSGALSGEWREDLPAALAQHVEALSRLAALEPEIPRDRLATEFDTLVLKVRERNAVRSQAERSSRLSTATEGRMLDVESAALEDLAAMNQTKAELGRRTLFTRA